MNHLGQGAYFPGPGTIEAEIIQELLMRDSASRARLSESLGVSAPAVSKAISQLCRLELVSEVGRLTSNNPGRPRTLLKVNSDRFCVTGIHLSRDRIRGVLVELTGKIVTRIERAYRHGAPKEVVLENVKEVVGALIKRVDKSRILGIGVGTPGPLDYSRGLILSPPDFPHWENIPLASILEEYTGLPTWLDRDANAGVLASFWYGPAQGRGNFAHVVVGSGIGLGIVSRFRLYRGERGLSGNLSHTTVALDGPECTCGSRGCLEFYSSTRAVLERTKRVLDAGGARRLKERLNGDVDHLSLDIVHAAAREGDPDCRDILNHAGRALGCALINVANTLNPELIVLSGPVVSGSDIVLDASRAILQAAHPFGREEFPLIRSPFGSDAIARGAAAMVMQYRLRGTPAGLLTREEVVPQGERVPESHDASLL